MVGNLVHFVSMGVFMSAQSDSDEKHSWGRKEVGLLFDFFFRQNLCI